MLTNYIIKGLRSWNFILGIHRLPMGFLYKGPVMRNACSCNDVIMDIKFALDLNQTKILQEGHEIQTMRKKNINWSKGSFILIYKVGWKSTLIILRIFTTNLKNIYKNHVFLYMLATRAPFHQYWITLIPALISNHMPSKVWCEIIYPFSTIYGDVIEAWEWLCNYIQQIIMDTFTYLC